MKNLRHQSLDFNAEAIFPLKFPKHSYHKSEVIKFNPKLANKTLKIEEQNLIAPQRLKRKNNSLRKSVSNFFSNAFQQIIKKRSRIRDDLKNKTENYMMVDFQESPKETLSKRAKYLWAFVRRKVFFPIQIRVR
jgi:hypothetical protein